MKIYNKRQETKELKFLKSVFSVPIINPNGDIKRSSSILPYIAMVSKCDILIFSEYKSHIGKGVYAEITHAQKEGKIVFCLRKKKLFGIKEIRIFDPNDWAEKYARIILKENK